METLSFIFYLFYLLNSLVILGAHGVNIQFYKHANFTGLVLESNSNGSCNNVPNGKITEVNSIRTDTCFIAYNHENCQSWLSEKYLPGDIIFSSIQLGRYSLITSFHTCNEEEGGDQLNLDMTEYYEDFFIVPAVLESYKNVCSCVNVPQHVQNMVEWSIDNHHNDLLAYFEPDCSVNKWDPKLIPAGHDPYFTDIHRYTKTDNLAKTSYSVQSFGPNPNAAYFQTSCKSSHVFTTESTPTIGSPTKRVMDINAGVNCQGCELLTNQVVGFKAQVDHLKSNQEKLQSDLLRKHNDDIKKLNDKFAELEQQCRNITHKIKSDLHKIFA